MGKDAAKPKNLPKEVKISALNKLIELGYLSKYEYIYQGNFGMTFKIYKKNGDKLEPYILKQMKKNPEEKRKKNFNNPHNSQYGYDAVQNEIEILKFLAPIKLGKSNNFTTYIIESESFKKKLFEVVFNKYNQKNIIMFDKILGINEFINYLENKYRIKKKYKLIIPAFLIKIIIFMIKKSKFRFGFFDKILTFAYKDDKWLKNL